MHGGRTGGLWKAVMRGVLAQAADRGRRRTSRSDEASARFASPLDILLRASGKSPRRAERNLAALLHGAGARRLWGSPAPSLVETICPTCHAVITASSLTRSANSGRRIQRLPALPSPVNAARYRAAASARLSVFRLRGTAPCIRRSGHRSCRGVSTGFHPRLGRSFRVALGKFSVGHQAAPDTMRTMVKSALAGGGRARSRGKACRGFLHIILDLGHWSAPPEANGSDRGKAESARSTSSRPSALAMARSIGRPPRTA